MVKGNIAILILYADVLFITRGNIEKVCMVVR
jgi:hypothetical protein